MHHGGKRPGAGRPTVEVKKQSFTVVCYPHQIAEIRKFAKSLNQKDASSSNQSGNGIDVTNEWK